DLEAVVDLAGAGERGGAVAVPPQRLGEGRRRRGARLDGVEAGEHGEVRRPRPWRLRDRPLEENSFAREGVEVRARRTPIAVGAEVVGTQGVEADEDDVPSSRLRLGGVDFR